MTEISIVIPVYNEKENIIPLIAELGDILDQKLIYEIIVVDDGSHDDTYQLLASLSLPTLTLIQHTTNRGQSAALLTGIRKAQYDWIVTLDGDGQNDPKDILVLLKHLQKNSFCCGIRTERQDSFLKKSASRIANGVRQWVLQDQCTDSGCGIKLFPRKAFLKLPHFRNFHRFLPALFKRAGLTILTIPVNHRPRRFGQSNYGIHNRLVCGIIDLWGVAWLMKRSLPSGDNDG